MTKKFYSASMGLVAAALFCAPLANADTPEQRDEPIYEAEGKTIRFSKKVSFIEAYMGSEMNTTSKNAEIVFNNSDVYFFNMTACPEDGFEGGDTYIHGVLSDGKITVTVPQLNNITDGNNTDVKNFLSLLVEGGTVPPIAEIMGWSTWFEPAQGESQVVFDIDAEGVISLTLGENQLIADCADPYMGADPWTIAFKSMDFVPEPGQDLTCYTGTVGIDNMVSEKVMTSEKYYDLLGKVVVAPAKGSICVRVVEYSDGTAEYTKTVVK